MNYEKVFSLLALLIDRSANYHSYSEYKREMYLKIAYHIKECVEVFNTLEFEVKYNRLKDYCTEVNELEILSQFIVNCIQDLNCYKSSGTYQEGLVLVSHLGRINSETGEYVESWHIFFQCAEYSFDNEKDYQNKLNEIFDFCFS